MIWLVCQPSTKYMLTGEQPMTQDEEGPYVRPPQILAEILRALLTFRQRLAGQLLTLTIDIAPPDVSADIRQVVLHPLHVLTSQCHRKFTHLVLNAMAVTQKSTYLRSSQWCYIGQGVAH